MTVAFDAYTAGGASFTHTPVGTPRGVLVLVAINGQATDVISDDVTYGGTAMAEVANSPVLHSALNWSLYGYFLGTSVPTGAQTVVTTASAGTVRVHCYTLTGDADLQVVATALFNLDGAADGDITDVLALLSRICFVAEVFQSGKNAVSGPTPLTGWTSRGEQDEGTEVNGSYSYDTVDDVDVTFGLNHAATGAEDVACLAVGISEVAGGGGGSIIPQIHFLNQQRAA